MINYWQQNKQRLEKIDSEESASRKNIWIDARSVTREDIRILEDEYKIEQEHILDILDQDELSRIEKTDNYTLIIIRLPVFSPATDVSYFTIPLGVIIFPNKIVTICWTDCEVLKDIAANRMKSLSLSDSSAFIMSIIGRADISFLRYLKEINRRSTTIQNELQRSVKNYELIQLMNMQKSLVFFTTSLKSNQLLIEKLSKTRIISLDEEDRDNLEDVAIDNRQAIEMADTYSNIIGGLVDTFTSIISNNLNIVMKRLTVISLVLNVPTLITSYFGMNTWLPFAVFGKMGLLIVTMICIVTTFLAMLLLRDKPTSSSRKKKQNNYRRRQQKKLPSSFEGS